MNAPVIDPVDDNDNNDNDNIDNEDHLSEHSPDEGSDSEESDADGSGDGGGGTDKAQLLEHLQSELHKLTLAAETVLSHQPRRTQRAFVAETKGLFDEYQRYGSMARLKLGVDRFLKLGDEKGKLRIEKEEEKDKGQDKDKGKGEDKGKPSEAPQSLSFPSAAAATQPKRPAHYGEAFLLDDTEDDDKIKFDPEIAFPQTRRTHDAGEDLVDPDDSDPEVPAILLHHHPHPLRTVDPDSIPYVTTLPWDPIGTKVSWPDDRTWPRGMLGNLNKVLSVEDAAARERLFHHVSKYGPAPVLRAGLAAQLRHEYASVFESAGDHYLGLTGETRAFLRDVHRRHRHRALNVAERRLLALACRVAEDSVQMFWEDAAEALRPYHAMRIFMAARELERDDHARKTEPSPPSGTQATTAQPDSQSRRAEVLRDHIARFNNEFRRGVVGGADGGGLAGADPTAEGAST